MKTIILIIFATTAITLNSARNQEFMKTDAEVEKLSSTPKYRILASIDGERNGINVLKRLFYGSKSRTTTSPVELESTFIHETVTDTEMMDVTTDIAPWKFKKDKLNLEFIKSSTAQRVLKSINETFQCAPIAPLYMPTCLQYTKY